QRFERRGFDDDAGRLRRRHHMTVARVTVPAWYDLPAIAAAAGNGDVDARRAIGTEDGEHVILEVDGVSQQALEAAVAQVDPDEAAYRQAVAEVHAARGEAYPPIEMVAAALYWGLCEMRDQGDLPLPAALERWLDQVTEV